MDVVPKAGAAALEADETIYREAHEARVERETERRAESGESSGEHRR